MKIKILFLWVSFCFFGACQTDHYTEMSIDFVVKEINKDSSMYSQVLLRVELQNTKTDLLKFGIETPEQHQQRLNYLFSNYKNDIIARTDLHQELSCVDVHFERMYMDLPYRNFILTFYNPEQKIIDAIQIQDRMFTQSLIQSKLL